MKDRKEFTLIELLVAITIIGIIMVMTLPAIHNLQRKNQEKKFDDYERAGLEAAKVYENQYEEDLFGRCIQNQQVHIDKTRPNCTTDGESTDWATSRTIKFNCEDPIREFF